MGSLSVCLDYAALSYASACVMQQKSSERHVFNHPAQNMQQSCCHGCSAAHPHCPRQLHTSAGDD